MLSAAPGCCARVLRTAMDGTQYPASVAGWVTVCLACKQRFTTYAYSTGSLLLAPGRLNEESGACSA